MEKSTISAANTPLMAPSPVSARTAFNPNPVAFIPTSPKLNASFSRSSSRSDSNSPSPYQESFSSRSTTATAPAIVTSSDVTTHVLPLVRAFSTQRAPSPPSLELPKNSLQPTDNDHYVFDSSSGSANILSSPQAIVAPSSRSASASLVLATSPLPKNHASSDAIAGVGGALNDAPRSPSFIFNASLPLPPPPAHPAEPPPLSPTKSSRSSGLSTQPLMGIEKKRYTPPSPTIFSVASDSPHPGQPTLSSRISLRGNALAVTSTFGSGSTTSCMSLSTTGSPAPQGNPFRLSAFGGGQRSDNDHTESGVGNDERNGRNVDEPLLTNRLSNEIPIGAPMRPLGDPRISLGNPLPWAHVVAAMTDEQQELEDAEAAEQAEGSIIVDSEESATDAGYESDQVSTTSTSLSTSVRDYAFENGRRYHRFREGRYNFPNDDVEQEREDMKHAMVKMLCQQLLFAPIGPDPQNILDIGTGTGIWAIEVGEQYSSATVLGIDLSPIQPEWVPPNVRFMVDDVESPWLHPRNHFDYIHSRHTVMAIKDWPRLLRRALEHMKPGGWMELQEIHHFPSSADDSMPADHPVALYWRLINQGLTNLGVDFHAAAGGLLANRMRECGFVNITERVFHVPIGIWPKNKVLKTVGLYWRTILLDGIQAIALGPLTRGCGWTREQVEVFLVDVRRGYHDTACHMYMPLHVVYGQKPEFGNGWY